jgi:hypothetical protein
MPSTLVLVRVQAKGGKFIGPDGGFSRVTLREATLGTVLAQGDAVGESGQLLPDFTPMATRQAIVTPTLGRENVLWLSAAPDQSTAGFTASLDITTPTLVEFTAEALMGGKPTGHIATQTMQITPGTDFTTEPGMVLVIPGLIVKVLSAAVAPDGKSVSVTAWVSMMCGCKIDPTLPWHPDEFTVTTTVIDPKGDPLPNMPVTLGYVTTSTFATGAQVPLPVSAGTYTITVTAVQQAEGNTGSASITIQVA